MQKSFPFLLLSLCLLSFNILACQSQEAVIETTSMSALGATNFGSEVEADGKKTRLFGCLPDDADCLKRSEFVNNFGCDWFGEADCKGCSKLDLQCLEAVLKKDGKKGGIDN